MRSPVRTFKRPLGALAAVLLILQAMLAAWHGGAMAGGRLGAVAGDGAIVICTAHGSMRLSVEGELSPIDPADDAGGRSAPDQTIRCPLCLALATDLWTTPSATAFVLREAAPTIVAPAVERPRLHARREPPNQRGPPSSLA